MENLPEKKPEKKFEKRFDRKPDSGFSKKRKTVLHVKDINYKNVDLLLQYITERGKILPRRITGISHSKQKLITKEIKRARYMALIPFVAED